MTAETSPSLKQAIDEIGGPDAFEQLYTNISTYLMNATLAAQILVAESGLEQATTILVKQALHPHVQQTTDAHRLLANEILRLGEQRASAS